MHKVEPVPAISVVMTAHNSGGSVREALLSMTGQDLRDIEIIAVDDASTDDTPAVLHDLAARDPRILVLEMPRNSGAFAAANAGLARARAPLVARMDSDDVSMPHRLAAQKRFMDGNPTCMLLSSGFHEIDGTGRVLRTVHRPRDAFQTAWIGRFHYPLRHPATMFRRLTPDGEPMRYSEAARASMDYEFYARATGFGDVVSMSEALLSYRVHDKSITATRRRQQLAVASGISLGLQAGLPASVRAALEPFNRAFLFCEPQRPRYLFEAMRAVVRHDAAAHPRRRPWMMRQSCALILMAMSRAGLARGEMLRAFGTHGADFLPSLAGKALENSPVRLKAKLAFF